MPLSHLSKTDIRLLIELTQLETVVPESSNFPYRVVRRGSGYSDDKRIGRIQAALSIALQGARDE